MKSVFNLCFVFVMITKPQITIFKRRIDKIINKGEAIANIDLSINTTISIVKMNNSDKVIVHRRIEDEKLPL